MTTTIRSQLGSAAADIYGQNVHLTLELLIDQLADAIAELISLPPERPT